MNAGATILFRTFIASAFVIAGVIARDAFTPPRPLRIPGVFAHEALAPPQSPPASAPAETPSVLCAHDEGLVTLSYQSFLDEFGSASTGCSAVPVLEHGRVVGIRTFGVRPGSAAARAGLKNGDVLVAVDDAPATNIDGFLALQRRLDAGGCGTLTWRRGDVLQTLHVH